MRMLKVLLLAGILLLVPVVRAWAAVPDRLVEVTFPPLSKNGNLDFWRIPWTSGDKVNGAIEVKVSGRVRGLTLRAVSNALTLDKSSRRVIPKQKMLFTRDDSETPSGSAQTTVQNEPLEPGKYLFDLTVDGIPGEDTYLAETEAAGEYWDAATNAWAPFVQRLPSIKVKAFADAPVHITSGGQLQAQWTNLDGPFGFLTPLERFIDRSQENFWFHSNPPPTVTITMPGRPNVATTQTFHIDVTMDPVLDTDGKETPWVSFTVQGGQAKDSLPDPAGPLVHAIDGAGNETLTVRIFRTFTLANGGQVRVERIPPGTYTTTLHIRTEWGTVHDLPVELKVRDAPLFPGLTLVLGIFVSLLANYWQRRQPVYRAQLQGRRWRHQYLLYGVKLSVVERTIDRLNGSVSAGDGTGATSAANLLEDLMRNLPDAVALDAALTELSGMAGVSQPQLWARVLTAGSVAAALDGMQTYCSGHPDQAVRDFGAAIVANHWYGGTTATAQLEELPAREVLQRGLRDWLTGLFLDLRGSATRIAAPGFWDVLTMLVLFVLVNGSLIALQMSQSYFHHATFGSGTDYLNLLFWGFAGDTTRTKLTDLAAQVLPGNKPGDVKPAGGNGSPTPGS